MSRYTDERKQSVCINLRVSCLAAVGKHRLMFDLRITEVYAEIIKMYSRH